MRGRRPHVLPRVAAAALACCIAVAAWVWAESERRLSSVYTPPIDTPLDRPREPVARPADAATLARGGHLAVHVALCTWCHADDLSGRETADDPWIGRLHASNLTAGRGGVGARYTDADFARAIRYGVTPEGRPLLLMPSHYLRSLRSADLGAIIAWLRTAEPVDAVRPETRAGPLTRIALVAGLAPELIAAEQATDGDGTEDEERSLGAYLVDIASCRVCHHADLEGGLHPLSLPGEPPPPSLTASGAFATWSRQEFARAMRTGVTPEGRTLAANYMPWPRFAGMSDDELDAIYDYLAELAGRDLARGVGTLAASRQIQPADQPRWVGSER